MQRFTGSAVFRGGAGGARAPPEFGGSQKGRSLISAYQSLAITTNTPGFEKLNTALWYICRSERVNFWYAGKYHWTVKRVAEFLRFRTLELSR